MALESLLFAGFSVLNVSRRHHACFDEAEHGVTHHPACIPAGAMIVYFHGLE